MKIGLKSQKANHLNLPLNINNLSNKKEKYNSIYAPNVYTYEIFPN